MSQTIQNTVAHFHPNVKGSVPRIDITGQTFGHMTALKFVRRSAWNTGWLCRCRCGNERVINGYFLRTGFTKHCGCLGNIDYDNYTEGHRKRGKHFACWCGMMTRCFNPNFAGFKKYGARGVTVCEFYQSPSNLDADLGERPSRKHTLERVGNKGHYSCGKCGDCFVNGWEKNVVWATHQKQARNRSSNHMLTYKGETLCMMDMAEKHGISYFVLRNRMGRDGMTVDEALTAPVEQIVPVEYRGKTYILRDLTREKGVNYNTIRGRLRKGWSVEAAIETPLIPRGSRKGKGVLVIK